MLEIAYIAHATAVGGRHGQLKTDNGALDLMLSVPGASDEKKGSTNPEQLFACAYAACFSSSLKYVLQQKKISIAGSEVHAAVALNKNAHGFFISVLLNINLPGMEKNVADRLVREAHQICPYSKATRGNIEVHLKVNSLALFAAA